jgi:hypothetical protein
MNTTDPIHAIAAKRLANRSHAFSADVSDLSGFYPLGSIWQVHAFDPAYAQIAPADHRQNN